MSDCLGMCLQKMDSGVSIGTSAWGVCVYSISGDVCTGVIVEDLMVITNIFLSLIWIYGPVCYTV